MDDPIGSQHREAICGKLAAFLQENGVPTIQTFSNRGIRSVALGALGTGTLLLCACAGDLRDIDQKVDRLLGQRSGHLGNGGTVGEAVHPARTWDPPDLPPRKALSGWEPTTANPAAEDLSFKRAAADRDVAARLRDLQQPTAPVVVGLDLRGVWQQAQKTGREYLNAEEDYIVASIRLLIERHQWSPRLFADSSVGFDQTQTDGNVASVLNIMNRAGVRQRLPYGGEVEARWVWQATENLRSSATEQYRQSSSLVLDASIPLLRGAGLVAQESRIQAERDLVYAARDFEDFRRQHLVALARDYFQILQQQAGVESTERQLDGLKSIRDRQKALYDAGRVAEFQVNLAENDVLSAESSLANARELLVLAVDRLRVRLGLPEDTRVELLPFELVVPAPDVTLDQASTMALEYRLDLQNRTDRLVDSERAVRNAMNDLLPDLNLTGSLTFPTDADAREGGAVYELDDTRYSVAMTMEWPLDRETERLQLRQSIIALQQAKRDYDRFRDELVIEVRQRVRDIERAELNFQLAQKRVGINERRGEEQRLKADQVDAQSQVDTANSLRDSERARDQARTDLRNSVLDYLSATATLRVNPDGTFKVLPGMAETAPPSSPTPAPATP